MAQHATRRRKRNVVDSSDNDDEGIETQPPSNALTRFLIPSPKKPAVSESVPRPEPTSPTKSRISLSAFHRHAATRRPTTRSSRRTTVISSSPTVTPEKKHGRAQKRTKVEDKGSGPSRTADLMTLFSNQTQKAQTTAAVRTSASTVPVSMALDDIFTSSDPISEDDDIADLNSNSASHVGFNVMKRQKKEGAAGFGTGFGTGFDALSQQTTFLSQPPSQMFVKPLRITRPDTDEEDRRPWSERFGPVNLDELAVHKRKVADVRRWLEEVFAGRMRQRLLILKGAAGSGKTTTLRLLAREVGCQLLEWRNPTGGALLGRGEVGSTSASAGFASFLGCGGKFGALDTDSNDDAEQRPPPSQALGQLQRTILLVEEFPNTFSRTSTALTSFRNTIIDFLTRSTPAFPRVGQPSRGATNTSVMPLVMVLSETLLTTASASADSFTAHRLLGPEILRHAGTGVIEFNAIAPTLLAKALELVVQKEARKSGRKRTPGPQVLRRLGDIGDIRNAISSLEFLCLKGDHDADWGAKVSFAKTKRSTRNEASLTRGEQETLELISRREASLGIFHAVGKVVYNKREEGVPPNDTVEIFPPHIPHHARPHRSLVAVDSLIDETGTDTHTFISALHENYALSCESTGAEDASTPLDYLCSCIEYLSDSDLMCPTRDTFGGNGLSVRGSTGGRDIGSHILRQDEMAFQVAARGLLFSLPCPVRRKSPSGRGLDANKMFYPTSLKLWRTKEELEGLVDMWSTKILRGEKGMPQRDIMDGASAFRKPGKAVFGQGQKPQSTAPGAQQPQDLDSSSAPLLSLGSAARKEMILERLPYTAHIGRARTRSGNAVFQAVELRDLDRIVTFQGIDSPSEEVPDDNEEDVAALGGGGGDDWATDRATDGASPRKKKQRPMIQAQRTASGHAGADGIGHDDETLPTGLLDVRSLVISDDDIEDN